MLLQLPTCWLVPSHCSTSWGNDPTEEFYFESTLSACAYVDPIVWPPFTDWKPAPRKNEVFLRQIQIYLRLTHWRDSVHLRWGTSGSVRGYPLVAAARNCVTSKEARSTAAPPGVSLGDAPRAKDHHQVSGPRASALGAAGDLTVGALVGQGDCTRES